MHASRLAAVGALIGDESRARILLALMDGRAFTSGELARVVGVSPSTASGHLARLLDAGMVTGCRQGRHHYFTLADPEVAQLLEALGAARLAESMPAPRAPELLAHARTCYDHLAGEVAVRIHGRLVAAGHLDVADHQARLTRSGRDLLASLGVDIESVVAGRRKTARSCLDWTERRPHLAGAAGAALLDTMLAEGWLVRGPRPRTVRITTHGWRQLGEHLGVDRRPSPTIPSAVS